MAGNENQTIGLRHRTLDGLTSLFTGGGKQLRDTDHIWSGVEAVLANAGNPAFFGQFDDFDGAAISTRWVATKSNSGTIAINAQAGGAIRFTTDTGATDSATLALGLHFLVSNGWTIMRAGMLQVSAITARKVEIGFNDANSETNGLAFSSASTPTAVAANAAVFSFHTDESLTTYSALSVKASGTPQKTLAVATPSTSYQHFTVAVDSAGNAYFYLGDPMVLVATQLLAVATTAVLTPWIAIANTTTAAKSLDVDYIGVYGARAYYGAAMLTYATYGDFAAIKRIGETTTPTAQETRLVRQYLERGTRVIDGDCRRRFFPFYETRRYSIPTNYVDLRQRAFIRDDLFADRDLLEIDRVQLGVENAFVDTLEVVPLGGLTARATTFTASNVDGLDALGGTRISVGDILVIETEECMVVDVDTGTNLVQIQRGKFETRPAAHAAGVTINKVNLTSLAPGIDFVALDFNIRPILGLRVVWPTTWAGRFTGSSWRFRYPQIYVTGYWGYHETPDTWWVDTLDMVGTGGLTASATSLPVASATALDDNGVPAWQDGFLYRIDDELMWGGAVADNTTPTADTIAIARGRHGTTALAHAEGTPIYRFDVLPDVVEANIDIAKMLRDADTSVGGRQGVSDMSVGVKIGLGEDTTKTIARLTRAIL